MMTAAGQDAQRSLDAQRSPAAVQDGLRAVHFAPRPEATTGEASIAGQAGALAPATALATFAERLEAIGVVRRRRGLSERVGEAPLEHGRSGGRSMPALPQGHSRRWSSGRHPRWLCREPLLRDQLPATQNERCREQRPGQHNQVPATHNERHRGLRSLGTTIKYLRGAAGIGLGTKIKDLRRSTSGAAGNGLRATIKYLRGAEGIGLGTTVKYLRRTTSAAAGNGLDTTAKYLVNQNAGADKNWAHNYKKAVHEL
jgi:hypothetical protein